MKAGFLGITVIDSWGNNITSLLKNFPSFVRNILSLLYYNYILFLLTHQIPYEMINFVKRCVLKLLNKRQTSCIEMDLWNFENQKEVWNEFFNHYTKLIIDDDVTFHQEYTYQLEVGQYLYFIIYHI